MMQSPKTNDGVTILPRSSAILLLITIADTTWRMFFPTIGGAFAGILLDHIFRTVPLWTVVMIIIGCLISVILIKMQIRNLRNK